MVFSNLDILLSALLLLLGVAGINIFFSRYQNFISAITFLISAAASLMALFAGFTTLLEGKRETVLLLVGLPDLPFHLRLDPLSGFFLVVVALIVFLVSIYSLEYVKGIASKRSITHLTFFYSLFVAGMFLVLISDDAFSFLVSWEVMAVSSYFLVMFEDEKTQNRKASFLYLLIAHIGAVAILLSFGVMAGFVSGFESFGGYTFDAMRGAQLPVFWASVAFFLSFIGFGAKAGVVPLHVWLPEAHPVAPSNVSALMSGAMLKTAIYGIVRVGFDLINVETFPWWWGGIVLIFALISAIMGVLYALMEHDLKRLLAYHSVENIGIILIGIALSMVFYSFNLPLLAALALIAGLYHTLNHAVFKSLLFMGAGAVLHATHQKNMEEMGGLIHKMPWTAALFLIGSISISALPPFNGFVSEWLTFQAFLLSPSLESQLLRLLFPLGAVLLALTGTLAATCFVKAFGITFLGHWRGHHAHIVEVGWFMRAGMIGGGVLCLILGVLPTLFINLIDRIPEDLIGARLGTSAGRFGWLWLTPIAPERASYSGPIALLFILAAIFLTYALLHVRKGSIQRKPLWDCGFRDITPRMQYTATAFSMPVRKVFGFLFRIKEYTMTYSRSQEISIPYGLRYHLRIRDRIWGILYRPVADISFFIGRLAGRLQHGRIQLYLLYSLITIIVLLLFMR